MAFLTGAEVVSRWYSKLDDDDREGLEADELEGADTDVPSRNQSKETVASDAPSSTFNAAKPEEGKDRGGVVTPYDASMEGSRPGAGGRDLCREALCLGRLDEALRQQEPLGTATGQMVQQLSRVYEKGRQALRTEPWEMVINEENKSLQLHWGVEVSDGYIRIRYSWSSDVDLVKVLSMRMEKDFQTVYDEDLVEVAPLGRREPAYSLWRSRSHAKSTGSRMDEVYFNFAANALREPEPAVFLMGFALPPGATKHQDIEIPPPAPGHERSPELFSFTRGSPTPGGGSRWASYVEYKMAPLLYKVLSVMPRFLLKKILRKRHEREFSTLAKFLPDSPDLDQRILESPSAPFYRELHLGLQSL